MTAIAHKSVFVRIRKARTMRRFNFIRGVGLLDHLFKCVSVRLQNISAGGFSADQSSGISVGEFVWIDLPGIGLVQSEVKWSEDDRFGASFVERDCLRLRFINGLPRAPSTCQPPIQAVAQELAGGIH